MITYKTEEEIRTMAKGGAILQEVLHDIQSYVQVGMTTRDVDKRVETHIKQKGGEPGFKKVKGYHWATCICVNDEIVHTPPSSRVLEDGDVVTIDSGVFYGGLHTDSAVTIQIGSKDSETTLFLETGKKGLKKAVSMAKVGNRIGHISQAFEEVIGGAGYAIVRELTGHGVGKELHEDPFIPCYVDSPIEQTLKLKEGMTLALEVMYAMGKRNIHHGKDGWSIKMRDGSTAACFEHTVALLKNTTLILA